MAWALKAPTLKVPDAAPMPGESYRINRIASFHIISPGSGYYLCPPIYDEASSKLCD